MTNTTMELPTRKRNVEQFCAQAVSSVQWDRFGNQWLATQESYGQSQLFSIRRDEIMPIRLPFAPRALLNYGGGELGIGASELFIVSDRHLYAVQRLSLEYRALFNGEIVASPTPSPDSSTLAVLHRSKTGVDCILGIDLSEGAEAEILVEGADFYLQPAWSPDGRWLAWMEWDNPNMPWDDSRLCIGEVVRRYGQTKICNQQHIAGGNGTAVLQPMFADNGNLYFLNDSNGPMRLTRYSPESKRHALISSMTDDLSAPAWRVNTHRYAIFPDERILAIKNESGRDRIVILDDSTGEAGVIKEVSDTRAVQSIAAGTDGSLAIIGATSESPMSLNVLNEFGALRNSEKQPERFQRKTQSICDQLSWSSTGRPVHGFLLTPRQKPLSNSTPLVVMAHGGPAMHFKGQSDAMTELFSSCGWAVLQVNYCGSSGYGRHYAEELYGRWGIADVEDCISGVAALVSRQAIDKRRVVIFGESAGGFTALHALIRYPEIFAAGVCLYPVSDLESVREEIPKFEQCYVSRLVGGMDSRRLQDRSPIFSAEKIERPLALFHGECDDVIPVAHTKQLAGLVRSRGIACELQTYKNEGHGWKSASTSQSCMASIAHFLATHVPTNHGS